MPNLNTLVDFYYKIKNRGWFPGSSGGLALLCNITDNSKKIYVTPNAIGSKLSVNDLFLLRHLYGEQDLVSPLNKDESDLRLSKWIGSFLEIFSKQASARCVMQITTKWSTLATRMSIEAWRRRSESYPNLLRLSHWGVISEIKNPWPSDDELLLPIIEKGDPDTITFNVKTSLELYPKANALLIRDYGMFIWGESLEDAEQNAELIEHLCELQVTEFNLLSK